MKGIIKCRNSNSISTVVRQLNPNFHYDSLSYGKSDSEDNFPLLYKFCKAIFTTATAIKTNDEFSIFNFSRVEVIFGLFQEIIHRIQATF